MATCASLNVALQMTTLQLVVVLLLLCSKTSSQPGGGGILHVNTTTNRIVDDMNRERYFHGVNVVVKGPPWIPSTDKFDPLFSFSEDDMKLLKEWGMNVIRYGIMWPGVEPQKGKYNESFIAAAKDIIDKAGKYGIYSILDMHQDVLSEKFCGEGIPDWAVNVGNSKGFPFPLGSPYQYDPKTGYPTPEDCAKHGWGSYQIAQATGVAYQMLYNNTNGLADSLANFWGRIAQEFVDNTFVLGYEIINEPWAGDVFSDPELLLPDIADRRNLAPLYERVHTAIRKIDPTHSLYFTSVTWDELGVGFEQVPGGPDFQNRSVLAWHFYVPPQVFDIVSFHERQEDIERLKCGGFLTEFSFSDKQLKTTLSYADKYLVSWAGWDYKPYVEITGSSTNFWSHNGTLNTELVATVSRTYAQAVAGMATELSYDPDTKVFVLKYAISSAVKSNQTEIYLNEKLHYSTGFNVAVTIDGKLGGKWFYLKPNMLLVEHDGGHPEGTVVTVTVQPKT